MGALITKSHHITYNTYFGPQDPRIKQLAIEIERKFLMPTWNKYIAVFNTNPQGALVARLISVDRNDLNFSETQITEAARARKILKVQNDLPIGHTVVGVSNVLPSQYGSGGAYIFPVKVTPPPEPPAPRVEIGQVVSSINDLLMDDEHDPSHYGY